MQSIFIAISSIFVLISPFVYVKAILQGKAKPHRTTRFVLLLITSLATTSLFAQNNKVAIWLAGVSTLESIVIFAFSLKYGMGGWTRSDIACLIIALAGIGLWQTTKNPVYALYFSIMADFSGMIPAIIKTYHRPDTEVWSFFMFGVIAAIFNLMALRIWTPEQYSYPLYILLINAFMVLLIRRTNHRIN